MNDSSESIIRNMSGSTWRSITATSVIEALKHLDLFGLPGQLGIEQADIGLEPFHQLQLPLVLIQQHPTGIADRSDLCLSCLARLDARHTPSASISSRLVWASAAVANSETSAMPVDLSFIGPSSGRLAGAFAFSTYRKRLPCDRWITVRLRRYP